MTWLMTVAAGAAIGYFLVQFIQSSRNANTENAENAENFENAENAGRAEAPQRRLHKSSTNKQIAGVCGGLAEYFNVDPSIVRIATLLLVLGWGSGLVAYLICALVLPTE